MSALRYACRSCCQTASQAARRRSSDCRPEVREISLPCLNPPIDFNPKPQNRLTDLRGLLGGHRERDFAHGAANRVELLTKIVWEIRRPDGMHFEERTLEPFLNRSVVCFKVVRGQLELLEYPEETVALEIEREPVVRLRHLARPLPVRGPRISDYCIGDETKEFRCSLMTRTPFTSSA